VFVGRRWRENRVNSSRDNLTSHGLKQFTTKIETTYSNGL
jgi:hypothetical protein